MFFDFLIDTQIPFSIYTPQQFLNILPETEISCENIHLVNIPSVQQFLVFQNQNQSVSLKCQLETLEVLQLNCSFAPPPLTNYSNIARSVRVKSLSSPHCAHTMRFNTVSFQEFHYDFFDL